MPVSEMITFGATSDKTDRNGNTPLHLVGCNCEMAVVKNPLVAIYKSDGSVRTHNKRLYARLAWVLRILVEQYANVGVVIGADTLLDLSCSWKDWDIISLLLTHVANPPTHYTSSFLLSTEKKRFSGLVKSFVGSTRPA
jgi:hypothetical protein